MSARFSIKGVFAGAAIIALMACQPKVEISAQDVFFEDIKSHCGKAYAGKLVSKDEADADFAGKQMIMHVRECSDTELRIPFHVDDDHSRTWVIIKTDNGLRLKHDHRHEDLSLIHI